MAKKPAKPKGETRRKDTAASAMKLGPAVKALISKGRAKGFLTYEELNDALPDDTVSPEKIDQMLMRLDEHGIDIIDESDVPKSDAEVEEAEAVEEVTEEEATATDA